MASLQTIGNLDLNTNMNIELNDIRLENKDAKDPEHIPQTATLETVTLQTVTKNDGNQPHSSSFGSLTACKVDLNNDTIITAEGIVLKHLQTKTRFLKQCIQMDIKQLGQICQSGQNGQTIQKGQPGQILQNGQIGNFEQNAPYSLCVLMKVYWKNCMWEDALQLCDSVQDLFPEAVLRFTALTHALMSFQLFPDQKPQVQHLAGTGLFTTRKESLQYALKYYMHVLQDNSSIIENGSEHTPSETTSSECSIDEKIEAIFCLLQEARYNEVKTIVKSILEQWTREGTMITNNITEQNKDAYERQRLIWILLILLLTITRDYAPIDQEKVNEIKNILDHLRRLDETDVVPLLLTLKLSENVLSKRNLTSNLMNIVLENGNNTFNDSIGKEFGIDWEFLKRNSESAHSSTNTHSDYNPRSYKPIIDFNRTCSEKLIQNISTNGRNTHQRNWRWCLHEIFNNFLRFNSFDHASTFIEKVSGFASTSDLLYFKGRLELFKNQLDGACQLLEQCLYLQPNHMEANLELAQLYFDSEDYISAKTALHHVFKYSKGHNYRAHLLMGKVLKNLSNLEDSAYHFAICVQHDQMTPIVDVEEFLLENFVDLFTM